MAIALVFGLTGCDLDVDDFGGGGKEQEDFHLNFDVQPGARLTLENFNGSVEITGWDSPRIEVHGTKFAPTKDRLIQVQIEAGKTKDGVSVRTVPPSERTGNTGAKYQIRVPKRVLLDLIKTTNGSVRVSNVEGAVTVRTTNGSVRLSDIRGDASAATSNGSVECLEMEGNVTVRTTNGRVKLDQVRGWMEASTSNGSITGILAESTHERAMRFSTTNGSIDLTLPGKFRNDIRASTTNGSIELKVPGGANFQLSARTSSASIQSELPVTGDVSKQRIEGKVGTGAGPLVDLSTSNSSIRIRKML
jgi:hypothetical protein